MLYKCIFSPVKCPISIKLHAIQDTIEVNETVLVESVRYLGTRPLFTFNKGTEDKGVGNEVTVTRAESVSYSYILQGVYTIKVSAR